MQGASHIKLTAGGGVASPPSPLDAATFTSPELRAAVEAAENWGTYVTVHAYTPDCGSTSFSAARFKVGKPSVRPRFSPSTTRPRIV